MKAPLLLAALFLMLSSCDSERLGWGELPVQDETGTVIEIEIATPQQHAAPLSAEWSPPTCTGDQFAVIGESSCVAIGDACSGSGWPEGTGVFVAPGGSGDGSSADSPLGTIQSGIDAAGNGGTVVIQEGTYSENLSVTQSVNLVGACVGGVILVATAGPALTLDDCDTCTGNTSLSNITVQGNGPGILVGNRGDELELWSILVDGTVGVGIKINGVGTTASLENVVVRNTSADPSLDVMTDCDLDCDSELGGRGMEVLAGTVNAKNIAFYSNRTAGASLRGAETSFTADGLISSSNRSRPSDLRRGRGLAVTYGATVTVKRVVLDDNLSKGIRLHGEGASLEGEDMVVSNTSGREWDQVFGRGLRASGKAKATIKSSIFRNNTTNGIALFGGGTEVTLEDVEISDTRSRPSDGTNGGGIEVSSQAKINLKRVNILRNRLWGVSVAEFAQMDAEDLVIQDTLGQEFEGLYGFGLVIAFGAKGTLKRGLIKDNRGVGIAVAGVTTALTMEDVVVDRTVEMYGGEIDEEKSDVEEAVIARTYGFGVAVVGGELTMDRFKISNSASVGLVLFDPRNKPGFEGFVFTGEPIVDAKNGTIVENRIGLNIQSDSIDIDQDFQSVYNYKNTDYDAFHAEFPVPNNVDFNVDF